MAKKLKKYFVIALTMALFVMTCPRADMYAPNVQNVRIGLYYDSNVLPSANLLNAVGSGYDFGYYDANREFVKVGGTDETAISMMKDLNIYISGGVYTDKAPGGDCPVVGCFHVLLDGQYADFDTAKLAAEQYTDAFPAYYSGVYRVCVGSYTSSAAAESAAAARGLSGSAFSASSKCVVVTVTGTTKILFEFDCGSDHALGVRPRETNGEKTLTWFKNTKYYGGFQYQRLDGNNLTVSNVVNIEDYIKGVLPMEMSPGWPKEALKAQALCARNYTVNELGKHGRKGFDLCNSPCCQVYAGTSRADLTTDIAVDETIGQYITYNGEICQVFYHSSDGGATENSENVWTEAVPYLVGVVDPYEGTVETGRSSWSYTYTNEEITTILQDKGYRCADIVSVTPVYTKMGNIYSLKFTDVNDRSWTFSKYEASTVLNSSRYGRTIYSLNFTVSDESAPVTSASTLCVNDGTISDTANIYAIGVDGTVRQVSGAEKRLHVLTAAGSEIIDLSGSGTALTSGRYVIKGSGWGHNVGMSQYGAKAMALLGFSHEDIIKFYFTGVEIG